MCERDADDRVGVRARQVEQTGVRWRNVHDAHEIQPETCAGDVRCVREELDECVRVERGAAWDDAHQDRAERE
ncbi:hypothetical protein RRF57_009857 [Xylaria bambusicola]|uniref:Uncharacterized protein n=1 Tax=Xylaria bambusicola TaxID=326684 RepID=A0AAN7UVN9_9PEZI